MSSPCPGEPRGEVRFEMWDGEATNFGALPPVELRRRRVRAPWPCTRTTVDVGLGWPRGAQGVGGDRRACWLPLPLAVGKGERSTAAGINEQGGERSRLGFGWVQGVGRIMGGVKII